MNADGKIYLEISANEQACNIMILIFGLILCFMGRRALSLFKVTTGLVSGILLALFSRVWLEGLIATDYATWVWVAILVGLVGMFICACVPKADIYAAAGLGGVALATLLLSPSVGGIVGSLVGRQVITAIFYIAAIIGAIFSKEAEGAVVAAATAVSGALAIIVSSDLLFFKTGFATQIWDTIASHTLTHSHFANGVYYMLAATPILAVLGAATQLLIPSRKPDRESAGLRQL